VRSEISGICQQFGWIQIVKNGRISGQLSLSILTAILQVNLGYPVFIEAKDDGGGEW